MSAEVIASAAIGIVFAALYLIMVFKVARALDDFFRAYNADETDKPPYDDRGER